MTKNDARYVLCEAEHCDCSCESVKERILTEDEAIDAAEIFAQLASPSRVRLLSILADGDMCVCRMADILGASQPSVSHHLKSLRQCGMVRFKKNGKRAVYSLTDSNSGDTIRNILRDLRVSSEQMKEE